MLDPNFGFLNTLAKSLPFVDGPLFNPYSFWGIVWVHTSTGGIWFKVMLLVPIFRRLGASLEEAARVSGANTAAMLRRITLPVLSPMILAVSVLSFIRGLQSFNTELLLGTPARIYVYSTRIYDYLQREPRAYGEATALGSMFLVVLGVLLFCYWKYLSGERKFTVVTGQGYSTTRVKLGRWRYIALAGCMLYIAVMMILPLLFLVIGSFMRRYGFFNIASPFTLAHWQNLLADPIFLESLKNSLIIASVTAAGGIFLYSAVAYLLVSRRTITAPLLESLCWIPHVLPGILLSLGVLWLFLSTPLRSVLYGTVWGIALALILADSPVTTQAFKAGMLQLGPDLEEAARVSGASWAQTYRRILLPLLAPIAGCRGTDELRQRLDQHQYACVTLQSRIQAAGYSLVGIQLHRRVGKRRGSGITDHRDHWLDDDAGKKVRIAAFRIGLEGLRSSHGKKPSHQHGSFYGCFG